MSRIAKLAAVASLALGLTACGTDSRVRGSGTIEMDEVDVSSLVGGRVGRLFVDEGDTVRAGDTLAVLERGELTAELQTQVATARRAAAQYRDVQAGPRRQEIAQARAELEAATAQAAAAETDYKRIEALYHTQAVSAAEMDRARGMRDVANANRRAAGDRVRLLEAGSRTQQVAAAADAAAAARAQVEGSQSRNRELLLIAPVDGVVLLRNFLPGEIASPGVPVFTLGDPDRLWIRVYVAAPHLTAIRRGGIADVRAVGDPTPHPGRVVEIASEAEFTPRAALTEDERANLVFGVKIALEPSGGVLKAGLPATATFRAASEDRARAAP